MIASRDAILLALIAGNEARPAERQGHSHDGLVAEAQELADAACKAWGHAEADGLPCSRCGRTPAGACLPHPREVLEGRARCLFCGFVGTVAPAGVADAEDADAVAAEVLPEFDLEGVSF